MYCDRCVHETRLFFVDVAEVSFAAEAHTGLLYSHPLAQQHLAPSLLLLYGDVEHTGYDSSRGGACFFVFTCAVLLVYSSCWKCSIIVVLGSNGVSLKYSIY